MILKEYQNPAIDNVLNTVTFTVEAAGVTSEKSPPLNIMRSGVMLHFMRYGLFKKYPEENQEDFVMFAPDSNGDYNCDLIYAEEGRFVQNLDVSIVRSQLPTPKGAYKPKNYDYQRTTLSSGFIYIFDDENPELHKEYLVDQYGNLTNISWESDQNKENDAYKEYRTPTSMDQKRKAKGHLVHKKGAVLWVAFSPAQWSVAYHTKLRTDCEAREKRMQKVCCTGFIKGETNPHDNAYSVEDIVGNFTYDQREEAHWFQHKLKEIAEEEATDDDFLEDMFITLHDPFNCADILCLDIDREITRLKAIMVSLQTGKPVETIFPILDRGEKVPADTSEKGKQISYLHRLARLTYDFVYNDYERTEQYSTDLIKNPIANVALDLTVGGLVRPFAENYGVDLEKLEKLLAVQERKKQRNTINAYRDELGNFMKSDYYQNVADDYLNSIADSIEEAKERISIHKIALGNYPNMHDRHLDLERVYKLKEDKWYRYINETLYLESPEVFKKTTKVLDYKIDIQDIKVLSLSKKTASTMDKIVKAYANHDEYLGKSKTLREKTLPILGKVSYFRDKHTRVATFKFKAIDEFYQYIKKYNLRFEINGEKVSLHRFKNHWHIEYKKMTQMSAEELIKNGKLQVDLKTNIPKRFEKEAERFLKSNSLAGVVVIIEAIIWAQATKKWLNDDSYKANEKFIFASIKLGAATLSLIDKMNVYEKYLVNKGVPNKVLTKTLSDFKLGIGSLKIVSSAITIFTASRDAYSSYTVRDTDATVIYGIAAGIGAVFLAVDVSALIGGGLTALSLGFLPAALLGGALIGCYFVVQKYFADTQLEGYFKNFPLSDFALPPHDEELPHQYIHRLIDNREQTLIKPWYTSAKAKEYSSYQHLEKAYTALLDLITTSVVLLEPAQQENANYHGHFDPHQSITNRFKAYIYATQRIHHPEDLEIKAWFYPHGIKAPLKTEHRVEITTFIYDFETKNSYRFRNDPIAPSCSVDFALPNEFYRAYREYRYGEVLFTYRIRVQDDEFTPANLYNQARYVYGNAQVYNQKNTQQKQLTSIFTANRYGQRTGVLAVKLATTPVAEAVLQPKIVAQNDIKMLQSYNPKLQ